MPYFNQKEIELLDEIVKAETLNVAKFQAFAQQCQDPSLRALLHRSVQSHQAHLNALSRYFS